MWPVVHNAYLYVACGAQCLSVCGLWCTMLICMWPVVHNAYLYVACGAQCLSVCGLWCTMLICMWPVVHNARFLVARNAPAPGVLPEADVLCVITTEKEGSPYT